MLEDDLPMKPLVSPEGKPVVLPDLCPDWLPDVDGLLVVPPVVPP